MATNLQLTSSGDFDDLMKNRLPAADYAQWRTEWTQARTQAEPASANQAQQFAQIMQMLTAPGAEAKLIKRLQPELAKMHGGQNQTLPIASGILEAAGKQMIAASPQLGTSQRAMATQGLEALIAWAKTTDFSDAKKAKKAVDIVCATARQLNVQTLAQWRALDYAQTMRNYGVLWNGLENLLHLYGLDLAGNLTAAKISATSSDATHATVKLAMTLAGKPLTGEWPMVKQDDHWYDAALLDAWRQAHPVPAATVAAPASAASGASVATPPASGSTAPAGSDRAAPSSAALH